MKPMLVELSTLKLDHKNARKHSERNIQEIMRSLQANEQYRPFVVQKSTNRIVVGNGMYEAMKRLKIKEGWAEFRDLTDAEATRLGISDNRTAELAEWDWPVLKDIIRDYGEDVDIPGWSSEECEALSLSVIENIDALFEDGEEHNEEKPPKTCPHCGGVLS